MTLTFKFRHFFLNFGDEFRQCLPQVVFERFSPVTTNASSSWRTPVTTNASSTTTSTGLTDSVATSKQNKFQSKGGWGALNFKLVLHVPLAGAKMTRLTGW